MTMTMMSVSLCSAALCFLSLIPNPLISDPCPVACVQRIERFPLKSSCPSFLYPTLSSCIPIAFVIPFEFHSRLTHDLNQVGAVQKYRENTESWPVIHPVLRFRIPADADETDAVGVWKHTLKASEAQLHREDSHRNRVESGVKSGCSKRYQSRSVEKKESSEQAVRDWFVFACWTWVQGLKHFQVFVFWSSSLTSFVALDACICYPELLFVCPSIPASKWWQHKHHTLAFTLFTSHPPFYTTCNWIRGLRGKEHVLLLPYFLKTDRQTPYFSCF